MEVSRSFGGLRSPVTSPGASEARISSSAVLPPEVYHRRSSAPPEKASGDSYCLGGRPITTLRDNAPKYTEPLHLADYGNYKYTRGGRQNAESKFELL